MPIHACCCTLKFSNMAMITGNMPLHKSPIRVKLANPVPAIRKTLVAPGFLEPDVRGSILPESLDKTMAKETEPSK